MASRWTEAEHTALISTVGDSVPMNTVFKAVQAVAEAGSIPKTLGAIRTRARDRKLGLDYSGSMIDGRFHKGVRRRHHENIVETNEEEAITIVGEPRVATTTQVPTTLETINTESDESIAQNGNRDSLIAIYDDISALLEHKNYTSVKSITINTNTAVLTLLKGDV